MKTAGKSSGGGHAHQAQPSGLAYPSPGPRVWNASCWAGENLFLLRQVEAQTFFEARRRAAVLMQSDPDDVCVRLAR